MFWLEGRVHGVHVFWVMKEFGWLLLYTKSEPISYEESLCPLNLFLENSYEISYASL